MSRLASSAPASGLLLALAVLVALVAPTSAQTSTQTSAQTDSKTPNAEYEFSFRPGKLPELAPGFVQRYDHPCGEVVTARVASLPAFKDTAYHPDPVMEYDSKGKPVRQWPLPVDYVPQAIQGVELLIVFGSRGFWVSPEGNLRPDSLRDKYPEAQPLECFAGSGAGSGAPSRCSTLRDVDTGVSRSIGYVTACR